MSEPVFAAAALALLVFAALSALDGLYLHLWRYRLHAHRSSWLEHVWHTGRAILFVPVLALLFVVPSAGALLWAGIAVVIADQGLELLDVLSEKDSRAPLGGLGSFEYAFHIAITTARVTAVVLALAARPSGAWSLDAPPVLAAVSGPWATVAAGLLPGAAVVAALHVWLAVRWRPSRFGAAASSPLRKGDDPCVS